MEYLVPVWFNIYHDRFAHNYERTTNKKQSGKLTGNDFLILIFWSVFRLGSVSSRMTFHFARRLFKRKTKNEKYKNIQHGVSIDGCCWISIFKIGNIFFYLKFDTKKDRILPPLLAMFDKISHFNRFIGNGRHGVSFFGCCVNIPFGRTGVNQ